MYKMMIVEDDLGIAQAIQEQVITWNIETIIVEDFLNIMSVFIDYQPHIILLDITLPFFNGYHWCQEIRKISNVPIIFISSASDNLNMVMAINMGADDFIAKPFDQNVLMAKIQAMLRRTYNFSQSTSIYEHRNAFLSTSKNTLTYEDTTIELTKNEYRILLCLMENKNKVVSREKLMQRLWESDSFIDDNTLTVNINRLRKKLDSIGLFDFIITKFGVGYILQ